MRLVRAQTQDGIVTGIYEDDIVKTANDEYELGADAELLAPTRPSTVYCAGRNYAATIDQMDYERPDQPAFFIKPPVSVVGPNQPIPYPRFSEEVTYAGELAAVIDEPSANVDENDVSDIVRGYTILNDIDVLDQPGRTARKAFDGSGPLGPWIETDFYPADVDMYTEINGEKRQSSNTDYMLYTPREIISFLSKRLTFQPGDVVAFGSPANPGTIEPGDEIEITYEGVGTLRNTVIDYADADPTGLVPSPSRDHDR